MPAESTERLPMPTMTLIGGIGYGTGLATQLEFRCLVCGGEIEEALDRLGSVTCSLHRHGLVGP